MSQARDDQTVRIALLKTDPLSQGESGGFQDDMRERTLEVLHELRALATGRHAVYLWTAIVLLVAGLVFLARDKTVPGPQTPPSSMTCVEGQVMVSRGSTWRPATVVPPGTSAVCAGQQRTVLRVGHGTTVRLQGESTFTWCRPTEGRLLFSISRGQAWFDLKDAMGVSFPSGQSSGDPGTAAEVSIQASEADWACRAGSLTVQDRRLQAGETVRIGSDGRPADASRFDSDSEWEVWNRDWASRHPTFGQLH